MSLISIIYKIFERILKKAFLCIPSETRTISPHQRGFLPRRSCLSNLLVFGEAVTRIMNEGHTVDDFAKAFDSVNHRFLSAKMKPFGLVYSRDPPRKVCFNPPYDDIAVGGEHSGSILMHIGVPQGSVIGPLLFLLFGNDFPDILEALTLLFAVDGKSVTLRTITALLLPHGISHRNGTYRPILPNVTTSQLGEKLP